MSPSGRNDLRLRYPLAGEIAPREHPGWREIRADLVERAFQGDRAAWTKLQRDSSRLGLLVQPLVFGTMQCNVAQVHNGTVVQQWKLQLPDQARSSLIVDVNLSVPRTADDRRALAVEILRRAYLKVVVALVRSRNADYATAELVDAQLGNLITQVDITETREGPTDARIRAATFDTIVAARQYMESGLGTYALVAITELHMRLQTTGFVFQTGYYPA